jgi:hypothetical protein
LREKKFLLSFVSVGGDPCVLVDWGDGSFFEGFGAASTCKIPQGSDYAVYNSSVPVDQQMLVTHVYQYY